MVYFKIQKLLTKLKYTYFKVNINMHLVTDYFKKV